MLLKGAKRLAETHRNSLLLLCYSPVFSEQFDLDKNRFHQGQVEQKMGNLACVPASRLSCLDRAHMPMQKDTRH